MKRKSLILSVLAVISFFAIYGRSDKNPPHTKFTQRVVIKNLSDPWELSYGPDQYLWVTEAHGYRVSRINPRTGEKTVLLDLNSERKFPRYDLISDKEDGGKPWPQGGLMGMALHPQLLEGKPYVYLACIYHYDGAKDKGDGGLPNWGGHNFRARIVRYTYDRKGQRLRAPAVLCDTIPASSDHNGGRLIIAPEGDKNYLYYAIGDQGAGQFGNGGKPNHAQDSWKYEGKILRFNTEPDTDGDQYDRWIPNDNPFNAAGRQNAVWTIGHRNPEGLAFARIGGKDFLYTAEHGPFSDDEINIIEKGKNYGHPLVIGYNDNNYNGLAAGASERESLPGKWHTTYPLIASENENARKIGQDHYRYPLFCFYPETNGFLTALLTNIKNKTGKPDWPSMAPSSIEVYTSSAIPGWKNSLLVTSLKEGKLVRLTLDEQGRKITGDTVNYFKGPVRYRDIAVSPDGKKLYLATDSSMVTSGPSGEDPEGSRIRGGIIEFTWKP